jgi:CRP/FNR family transcriptional regulator, cyclic AMP receptor protein
MGSETSNAVMAKNSSPGVSSTALFKKLASLAVSREYGHGEIIFSQGDIGDSVYRIESGYVKLAVASARSNKAAIAILRAGNCFGEGCLLDKPIRTFTATSIQETTIGRITKQAVNRRLLTDPAFAKAFISYLLLRIGRVEDNLAEQLVHSSEQRLARLLLQLSDFGEHSESAQAVVSVDQGTLAQVVGTTRSRVSHFMNEFRKKGFIEYNGSLQVYKSLQTFLLSGTAPA